MAIDLGTEMTRVFLPGKGIVMEMPSLMAVRLDDGRVVAIGKEAKQMMGRTPDEIEMVRPVQKGMISEYKWAVTFVEYVLRKSVGTGILHRPEVLVSVPVGVSEVERKILVEVFLTAGAKVVHIVPKPLAGAVGAKVPMAEPVGSLVLDIGGGVTEVSLLSMGNVISAKSEGTGGVDLTNELCNFLESKHHLIIGFQAAEKMKQIIGSAKLLDEKDISEHKRLLDDGVLGVDDKGVWMEISGRDELTGLPNKMLVYNSDVVGVVTKQIKKIGEMLGWIMKQVPPELVTDVMDKGVVMMGGGSLLKYLPEYLTELIGIPCYLVEDPQRCVIEGSGRILENLEMFEYTLG